jgi:hypothetical protein
MKRHYVENDFIDFKIGFGKVVDAKAIAEVFSDLEDRIVKLELLVAELTYNPKELKEDEEGKEQMAPCLICHSIRTYLHGGELCHTCCMDGSRQKRKKYENKRNKKYRKNKQ